MLFLDESGGARAPMAEAMLRHLAPHHDASSAGWAPSHVRPGVRAVLEEVGMRGDRLRARSLAEVAIEEVDLVVSFVLDEGALRLRPHTRRLHWGLPDPLAAPADDRLEALRASRDEVERRLRLLLADPGMLGTP